MDSRGETRQDQIAAIPLFRDLPARQHRKLASIGVVRSLHKGDIIFHQGEEGTGFYVVISGRVKVFKLSAEGKEQILHIFDAGEPFGEVPVFAGKRFPAHAEALEDSRVFFFQRAAFVGLIQGDPSLALNMLAMLSQRLRRFAALVEDLSLKEVPGLSALSEPEADRPGRLNPEYVQGPAGRIARHDPRDPFTYLRSHDQGRPDRTAELPPHPHLGS
jgi:CRP-like cAMP-binding protein